VPALKKVMHEKAFIMSMILKNFSQIKNADDPEEPLPNQPKAGANPFLNPTSAISIKVAYIIADMTQLKYQMMQVLKMLQSF
jgi:hypothetical protein